MVDNKNRISRCSHIAIIDNSTRILSRCLYSFPRILTGSHNGPGQNRNDHGETITECMTNCTTRF